MIITIARECGSGGTPIGKKLAERYNLPLYDMQRVVEIGTENGVFDEHPEFFSEQPLDTLMSALAFTTNKAKIHQFAKDMLSKLLPEDNFILVGRCGNAVYRDHKDCFCIFLCGDFEDRVAYMQNTFNLSRKAAEAKVKEVDENRASYHSYYTGETWKKANHYDLCLNTSRLGLEQTEKVIAAFIDTARRK